VIEVFAQSDDLEGAGFDAQPAPLALVRIHAEQAPILLLRNAHGTSFPAAGPALDRLDGSVDLGDDVAILPRDPKYRATWLGETAVIGVTRGKA
jgi:hypothetical protein